jgi:hypothetical protein
MKHLYTPPATRLFLATVLSTLILLAGSSCSRKISFQDSSVVPAAEGSVKLKKDFNNNPEPGRTGTPGTASKSLCGLDGIR